VQQQFVSGWVSSVGCLILDFDNNNNETFGSGPDSCKKA
jgi:hypothetical protein